MKSLIFVFTFLFIGSLVADDEKSDVEKAAVSAESCENLLKSLQDETWDRIRILTEILNDTGESEIIKILVVRTKSGGLEISYVAKRHDDSKETVLAKSEATVSPAQMGEIEKFLSPTVDRCKKHFENGETDLGSGIVPAHSHMMGNILAVVGEKKFETVFNSQFLEEAELNQYFKGIKVLGELSKSEKK